MEFNDQLRDPVALLLGEEALGIHWTGVGYSKAGLKSVAKKKFLVTVWKSNLSPLCQLVPLYRLR